MNQNPTCTRDVVVNLNDGLHMRPLSEIVKTALRFNSSFVIRKGDRAVDAKSILDMMTLAAEQGAALRLEAQGEDADDALAAIVALFDRNFVVEEPA
jgi:phosphocarrier protein